MTTEQIDTLRESVSSRMGEKRFAHTLAVETEIAALGELYLPERINELRAAALLHDITKEWTTAQHTEFLEKRGIAYPPEALRSPAVLHSLTAAALIPESDPAFALPEILSAVSRHTTGAPDMSLFDKLLFLADYTEPTRKWENCRVARETYWDGMTDKTDFAARVAHLNNVILFAMEHTIAELLSDHRVIVPASVDAYNAFATG